MKKMKIACLTALCIIAGSAFAAPSEPARTPQALQARLAKMAPGATVECHKDSYGNPTCTADGYKVAISGCSGDLFFGQTIKPDGATLDARLAGDASQPLAKLQTQHFLCIAATATQAGKPTRLFVEALPADSVPGCKKAKDLCQSHPVTWLKKPAGPKCEWIGKDGDFTGDCAAGWVDEDRIDAYSMGLNY